MHVYSAAQVQFKSIVNEDISHDLHKGSLWGCYSAFTLHPPLMYKPAKVRLSIVQLNYRFNLSPPGAAGSIVASKIQGPGFNPPSSDYCLFRVLHVLYASSHLPKVCAMLCNGLLFCAGSIHALHAVFLK